MNISPHHPAYQKAMQMFLFKGIPLEQALHYCMQTLPHHTKNDRPTQQYIWRTSGDGRVRREHAANNGRIFSWDNPPATGHPGEDYGCRCVAEPYYPPDSLPHDPPIESVYPETLIGGAASVLFRGGTAAVRGARAVYQALVAKPSKPIPRDRIFKRPEGVPKDWVREPAARGEGVKYVHPNDRGTYVRISRSKPSSKNPGQQRDYVAILKNGQRVDKNGNPIKKTTEEAHIPLKDFKFKPEIFK